MPTRIAVASDSAIETEHPSFENGVQPCRGEPALFASASDSGPACLSGVARSFSEDRHHAEMGTRFFHRLAGGRCVRLHRPGIAAGAAAVAKVLFYVAVILFLVFLVLGLAAMRALK